MEVILDKESFEAGLKHIFNVDPDLQKYQSKLIDISYEINTFDFWSLVRVVVGQQLSGTAARTIVQRISQISGSIRDPEIFNSIKPEVLRACGMSNQKVSFLLGISSMLKENSTYFEDLERLDGNEMIEELTKIKGIGPWSATILAAFSAGKSDIMITGDVTINKVISCLYKTEINDDPKRLLSLVEHWKPFRSIGCMICYEIFDRKLLELK